MGARLRDGISIAVLALLVLLFLILPFANYEDLGAALPIQVLWAPALLPGLVVLSPVFPALAVVAVLQHRFRWLTRTLTVVCLLAAALGSLLLLILAGLGPQHPAGLQMFLTLILALLWWMCLQAVWRYSASANDHNTGLDMEIRAVAVVAVALPIVWSLGSGALAAAEAEYIAAGRPYCLATDRYRPAEPGADYGTIASLADLTGIRFHSTKTGYKETSRWYFNGLLLVQDGDGVEYWYWSHANLRYFPFPYQPVEKAIARPVGACVPKVHFLSTLGV